MRAVAFSSSGGPDVLAVVDLPVPEPLDGQVRIRVAAATVNPTDTLLRSGARDDALRGVRGPYVPGMEVAGVVEEVAEDVPLERGDRVVAIVEPSPGGPGGYAEQVVVDSDQVARAPRSVSTEQAATLPMNGLTARLALDSLALGPDRTVLVTGAAGALGGYLVQLGHGDGLRVVADAKPADIELVRSLGADEVVPRGDDVAARVRELVPDGVDAVLDASVQGAQLFDAVRDGGQLAVFRGWDDTAAPRGITVVPVVVREWLHEGQRLQGLVDLVDAGGLTLRVAQSYPAEQAADAHRRLEAGGTRGRLVLTF